MVKYHEKTSFCFKFKDNWGLGTLDAKRKVGKCVFINYEDHNSVVDIVKFLRILAIVPFFQERS